MRKTANPGEVMSVKYVLGGLSYHVGLVGQERLVRRYYHATLVLYRADGSEFQVHLTHDSARSTLPLWKDQTPKAALQAWVRKMVWLEYNPDIDPENIQCMN